MTKTRSTTVKRIDASTLKKNKGAFDIEQWRRLAKELRDAVRKEEAKYGKLQSA